MSDNTNSGERAKTEKPIVEGSGSTTDSGEVQGGTGWVVQDPAPPPPDIDKREVDQPAQGSSLSVKNKVSGGIRPDPPKVSGAIWVEVDPAPDPSDIGEQGPGKIRTNARRRYERMLKEGGDADRLERERKDLERVMKEQRSHIRQRRRTLERLEESAKEPRPEFRGSIAQNIILLRRRIKKNQRACSALRLQRETLDKVLVEWRTTGEVPEASGQEIPPARSTAEAATDTQLDHLKTARKVIDEHPEISSSEDWKEYCPGSAESVKKRLHDLCKKILGGSHLPLPSHYYGFGGGFQALVKDLWRGEVYSEDEKDSERQR